MDAETNGMLNRIEALADDIDDQTEALNAHLDAIVQELDDIRIGVRASVPLGEEGYQLVWCKHNRVYGLYVDNGEQIMLVRNVSRELRVLATHQVPALLAALVKAAEERIRNVKEAIAVADEVIGALIKARR